MRASVSDKLVQQGEVVHRQKCVGDELLSSLSQASTLPVIDENRDEDDETYQKGNGHDEG